MTKTQEVLAKEMKRVNDSIFTALAQQMEEKKLAKATEDHLEKLWAELNLILAARAE